MSGKQKKKEFVILTIIFAGYLIFNGILLFRHELWRDEANVWLMAKELSPIQLLRELKYQGHPCLWYFLVMPFAKAGLPFRTISVISYLVMAAGAGVFLYKAPIHGVTKALCLFSPMFSYYYSVVARNYCLSALILILLAYFYSKRNEKCILYGLLLGLLVQTDSIVLLTAGLISLMWLAENLYQVYKKRNIGPLLNILRGIWIPFASLLLWIAQFYQVSDSPEFGIRMVSGGEFIRETINYVFSILTRLTGGGRIFDEVIILLFFAGALIISCKLKNFWAMAVMTASFLFEAIFSEMVYQLHIWHFIALCFVLIWFVWVTIEQKKEKETSDSKSTRTARAIMELLLVIMAVSMFGRWNAEEENSSLENALHGIYSDGKYTAEYIKNELPEDALFISDNIPYASTVLAYLGGDYEFYYGGEQKTESYADWSKAQSSTVRLEELLAWVKTAFPQREEFYILKTADSCIKEAEGLKEYEICYQTPEAAARGEEYTIYRVKIKETPEAGVSDND